MSVFNKKGFLLADALINVLIVSLLCLLCVGTYKALDNYDKGFEDYVSQSNERYEAIYNGIDECEKCVIIEEEDSSNLEP